MRGSPARVGHHGRRGHPAVHIAQLRRVLRRRPHAVHFTARTNRLLQSGRVLLRVQCTCRDHPALCKPLSRSISSSCTSQVEVIDQTVGAGLIRRAVQTASLLSIRGIGCDRRQGGKDNSLTRQVRRRFSSHFRDGFQSHLPTRAESDPDGAWKSFDGVVN